MGPSARRIVGIAVALAVLGATGAAAAWRLGWIGGPDPAEAAREVADAYLAAWERGEWAAMRRLAEGRPPDLVDTHSRVADALGVREASYSLRGLELRGPRAEAGFDARLTLAGLGRWEYRGEIELVRTDGDRWVVAWSPAVIHPALRPGLTLDRTREWPPRAPIEAEDGTRLTVRRPVVEVGIQLSRVERRRQVVEALVDHVGVSTRHVREVLNTPGAEPDWFLPVITLRQEDYQRVRPDIYPVPGLVFREKRARVLRETGFAQHVVGRVGDVTADLLEELGATYVPGDAAGLSGLERAMENRLAGRPSGRVQVVDGEGEVVRVVHRFPGEASEPVRTTLDVGVQTAAERALGEVEEPSALVAVDARTGAIRAVASRPLEDFNRAMAGHYPPGSTFKVVTTAAILGSGTRPDDPVPCPPERTVGGKVFRNFEGEGLGTITFAEAFAQSCNTAFVELAQGLNGELTEAAQTLGFDVEYELPLPAAGGSFPAPEGPVDLAAAAIGQGRVLASPLHMATVVAAVASGTWRAPRLLATEAAPEARKLDPDVAAALRDLMRRVVVEGTGTAADVPGAEVAGKTGTAEFDDGSRTHAWFVGFRDDLAFAVLVEAGGVGGQVAAPIAARFLEAL